jgi:lysophospholipid acyltransferase (LPLAT)-like uncharacterized protein
LTATNNAPSNSSASNAADTPPRTEPEAPTAEDSAATKPETKPAKPKLDDLPGTTKEPYNPKSGEPEPDQAESDEPDALGDNQDSTQTSSAREDRRRPMTVARRIRKFIRASSLRLAFYTVPWLYYAWHWFVYKTSRVEILGMDPSRFREHYNKGAWAVWHDEVVIVAYAFGRHNPTTLASVGDSGEVITRLLEVCGFTSIVRGGSSKSLVRRRTGQALREMLQVMSQPGCQMGITTDGSSGPRYRMKPGVCRLAQEAQVPIAIQAFWCKRYFCLPTWDKSLVPLPFNHIVHIYRGPFYPPPTDAPNEKYQQFCKEIERQLSLTKALARRRVENRPAPADWVKLFREDLHEELRQVEDLALELPRDESFGDKGRAR